MSHVKCLLFCFYLLIFRYICLNVRHFFLVIILCDTYLGSLLTVH